MDDKRFQLLLMSLDKLIEQAKNGDENAQDYLADIAEIVLEQEEHEVNRQLEWLLPLALEWEVRKIARSRPKYLALPAPLADFEHVSLYQIARDVGRLMYHLDQYTVDEATLDARRNPRRYSRQDLYSFMKFIILIPDDQLHMVLPLAYRVGVVVGWLSALSISQKEDAQAAMVMLTALVAPLLIPTPGETLGTSPAGSIPNKMRLSAKASSSRKSCKK